MAPQPRPADFDAASMSECVKELSSRFSRSTYTIQRWLSEMPAELREQRNAIMRERQTQAGRAAFDGAQKMLFERDDAQSMRRHLQQASDQLVAAHRRFSAKTGWPVREYAG